MRAPSRPTCALTLALFASVAAAACGSAGTTTGSSPSGKAGSSGAGAAGKTGKAGSTSGQGAGGDGAPEGGSSGQGEGGAPSTGGSSQGQGAQGGGSGQGAQGGDSSVGGQGQGAGGTGGSGGSGGAGAGAGPGAGGSSGNQAAGGDGGSQAAGGSGTAGTGTGGTGTGPSAFLTVVPADAVFTPPSGVGLSAAYKAVIKKYGEADQDVTAAAVFSVDPPAFGQFLGATLKAPAGQLGKATVKAEASGLTALTGVTIAQGSVVFGPGAGADSPGKFGGPSGGDSPSVVYPPDGVLVPPNMNSLELHFVPGSGQTLFEIAFSSPTVSLTVYTTCTKLGSGCVYVPDDTFWKQIANAARGGEPVSYQVRGVDGGSPGQVGKSASRSIQFASDDLSGGIYYWNSGGTIQRYDFGLPNKASETYLNAFEAGGFTCVGCHAMSRDGKKMAVGVDIPGSSPYRMVKVATKTLAYTAGQASNFFAFDPTGNKVLTSNGVNIALADANSGQVLIDPIIPQATMPDWSADGNRVVFARPKSPAFLAVPGVDSAQLMTLTYDGSAWGSAQTLVPFDGQNNYYPAFSPDNGWVVFNRSPSNRNSFDNASAGDAGAPDGELWGVKASGGAAIRLDSATQAGDSWPKWAPQLGTYAGGPIMWLTFSSWRGYGLRLDPGAKAQLWMVAFDPQRAAAGKDPTFPAFWLPFQDINSGNHIAQWVTHVDRKPCTSPSDCAVTETCSGPSQGVCVPK